MTHAVCARWFAWPECLAEAEAALTQLVEDVRAGEPGTLIYLVQRARGGSLPPPAPGEIVFFEVYRDEAAFRAHLKGRIYTDFLASYGGLFVPAAGEGAGPFIEFTVLDSISGFARL